MRVGLHVFVFVINPILMNGPRKRPPSPLEPTTLTLLEAVRVQLLRLHKVLLDDERAAYERLRRPKAPRPKRRLSSLKRAISFSPESTKPTFPASTRPLYNETQPP
jgi:hypothetical protein